MDAECFALRSEGFGMDAECFALRSRRHRGELVAVPAFRSGPASD